MNPFKFLLLALFAPRFFADMPPREGGTYIAGAYKYSPFYVHTPEEVRVKGRRRAYVAARWMALVIDWNTATDEVGVRWTVTRTDS